MEPTERTLRLRLVLGKYRVINRENNLIKIALGGSTTMTVTLPDHADVKEGDLLTFYTEVLYAKPSGPPVQ